MARKTKIKKYSATQLAVILIVMLVLEGVLLGATAPADWQQAIQVLDVSSATTQLVQQLAVTFQPMLTTYESVYEFYVAAADALTPDLDLSNSSFGSEVSWIYHGVTDFYQQAATQMAAVLDLSNDQFWPGSVSGAVTQK